MATYLKYIILTCICIGAATSDGSQFANPVLDSAISIAKAVKLGKFYYLAVTRGTKIDLLKSPFLTDFRNAESRTIYKAPAGYTRIDVASILIHKNDVYLYFSTLKTNELRRLYAIKAKDSTNLFDQWSAPTQVLENVWKDDSSHAGILQRRDQLYCVWSSSINSTLSLYIARMASPTEAVAPVNLLRQPKEDWECYQGCINESPAFTYNRNSIYMVFGASQCCMENTTIGFMSLDADLDPMQSSNWVSAPDPIFTKNQNEDVYIYGFPSFVSSPDETETWMMYTTFSAEGPSQARIEKIEWNKFDGTPKFPQPRGNGVQQVLPSGEPAKFKNPILDEPFGNPSACLLDEKYYLVLANSTGLVMLRSNTLQNFRDAQRSVIYTVPEGSGVSAGRIVEIDGDFYIYFYMKYMTEQLKMYVMKAANSSNLMQGWGDPELMLNDVFEGFAYQGVALKHNGKLYFAWASSNAAGSKAIYIAPMSSPTEVVEPVVLLKEPSNDQWECHDNYCLNDYPSSLYGTGATFLVFTGNKNIHPNCSLSYMSIETDRDPLDVMNWYISPKPVFYRNDAENVYASCHATFVKSPDGLENWMLYQASNSSKDFSPAPRAEKITLDSHTGTLVFPRPHGFSHPQPIPSSFQYFSNPVIEESSVSPSISRIGSFYYLLLSDTVASELILLKSAKLTDFRNSERKSVFSAPEGFSNMGIARMHNVNGKLCIYFSMEELEYFQRIFVACAEDPSNPMGNWELIPTLVAPSLNHSAYHGSILQQGDDTYLTWVTPHPATGFNSISIAKLENGNSIVEPIALIRHPFELWECDGGCSNEAPYFIYNGGTAYLVHSVGMACKDGNALTYMSIESDKDPLNAADWVKASGKTFEESEDENVFCPSHATFTVSPDGLETWMIYHATDSPHPDAIKTARIEKVTWEGNGESVLPNPHGTYTQQLVPGRIKFY